MRCTSNFRIKINRSIFLNFFIVPPPPMLGRDEPNNTSTTLTIFIITQSIRIVYISFNIMPNSKLRKTQVCKIYRHKRPFPEERS